MARTKYQKGESVWYIPGYRGANLIAIQCTIRKVEEKRYGRVYWIDEPLRYYLDLEDLYYQKTDAIKELKDRIAHEKLVCGLGSHKPEIYKITLEDWRKSEIEFNNILDKFYKNKFEFTPKRKGKKYWVSGYEVM